MAQLFGFSIDDSYKKPAPSVVSPVPRNNEDGADYYLASGFYGQYLDVEGVFKTEYDLIRRYREMALHPEVDSAIEDILCEAIVADQNDSPIQIDLENLKVGDKVKDIIRGEFQYIKEMLDFDKKAHEIFRNWYVDGRIYYHKVIDLEKPEEGIKELRYIDALKIKYVREQKKKGGANAIQYVQGNKPGGNDNPLDADFEDGSVLTEFDLDTNSDQVLFAQQEILDKLSGIEEGATADQTNTEIKTAYEANSDTNAFTDAEKTKLQNLDLAKLQGIETGATADQSSAEIKTAYEANSDTNAFTDAEKTKLAGISASAGATTFTGIGDTPANFSGAGGKTVKVNSGANALEFVDVVTPTQDIVDDTSPQLGGDLDVQAREINTSTTNANIKLNPNGSGAVEVKGDGSSNDGKLQLNCSQNSHGVKLQSPAHSAGQSYTMILPDNQIAADKFLKVKSITGSGATAVGQLEYADGGGGATGGGGEKIFHESENQMDSDYTISANHNAIVPTPLTINATLTVGATSTVTFV